MPGPVLFEVKDGVGQITLNRPDAANTLNLEMAQALLDSAARCEADPEVRAVLVSGAGRMFCAGGDLRAFAGQGDALPRHLRELTTYLHAAISRLIRMEAPVVAAVQGSAAGAGMSLACAADVVIAAESAKFVLAYTAVGLAPDGSSTYLLPRLVGRRRALELALTNRALSGAEAAEWGLVSRVVADAALAQEAATVASDLATGATSALGAAKRLLLESGVQTLESQMELEAEAISAMGATADAREGIAAFLEKRPATFSGS